MNFTNQLGQLTELWCQMDFCERNINLSSPVNPSCRYDFLAEIEKKIYRIQCKTAHPESNNRISIRVKSKNWNNNQLHSYIGEIDFFYTHWQEKGYLIPIETCTEKSRLKYIRLNSKKLNSKEEDNILYGEDYELDEILMKISNKRYLRTTIEMADRKIALKPLKTKLQIKNKEKPVSRLELKNLIRTTSFVQIGKQFNVTDNTIRK